MLKAQNIAFTDGAVLSGVQVLTQAVCALCSAERGTVFLYNPPSNELVSLVRVGEQQTGLLRVPCRIGPIGQVFTTGIALNVLDSNNVESEYTHHYVDTVSGPASETLLCFPLKRVIALPNTGESTYDAEGIEQPLGVVLLCNKRSRKDKLFTVQDEVLLSEFCYLYSYTLQMYNTKTLLLSTELPEVRTQLASLKPPYSRTFFAEYKARRGPVSRMRSVSVTDKDIFSLPSDWSDHKLQKLICRIGKEAVSNKVYSEGYKDQMSKDLLFSGTPSQLTVGSTLKEVQIYVNRMEACWMESRRSLLDLETKYKNLQRTLDGVSKELSGVLEWCDIRYTPTCRI
eukprot:TRINITY_DN63141_c0_g1_i1.p1 TRINITY_DN63141_c0_g1~~TRINITY_DN63141_c0_g1_i1.p1  ORF type:complete len:388 (+),score=7.16 TRINITY_DN63141_c0_g1_i1:141-1166(+)